MLENTEYVNIILKTLTKVLRMDILDILLFINILLMLE